MWTGLSPSETAAGEEPGRQRPFFVVINAGSGGHDAQRTEEVLAGVFEGAGRPAAFERVEDPSVLARACERAAGQASERGGILVAVGGDGTINTAAQAALERDCPLGVVPRGTFNYLARDHGLPLDAAAAAGALLRARPRPVQAGLVNGQVFLVNASLGLYPQLLQDREHFKSRLGRHRWVALLSALATVFRWGRQLRLAIELDGHRSMLTTTTLFVGNNRLQVEQVGLDAGVAERTGRGRLAGIVTGPVGPWVLLAAALRAAMGRLADAGQVHSFTFQQLDVALPGRARVKVATDGEVRWMRSPLRFEAAPRPLQLMLPAAGDRVARE